jgi:hypothetical protein
MNDIPCVPDIDIGKKREIEKGKGKEERYGTAVSLDGAAHDAELLELGHQFERKLGLFIVLVDLFNDYYLNK